MPEPSLNSLLRTTSQQRPSRPIPIRCVTSDTATPPPGKRHIVLTNDFTLPPLTITELYRQRWQIELIFKRINQHLRIKAFYGTSPNAVYVQVWIAISTYLLVAIVRRRPGIDGELHTLIQILSLTLFEKTPRDQALLNDGQNRNQSQLFDL